MRRETFANFHEKFTNCLFWHFESKIYNLFEYSSSYSIWAFMYVCVCVCVKFCSDMHLISSDYRRTFKTNNNIYHFFIQLFRYQKIYFLLFRTRVGWKDNHRNKVKKPIWPNWWFPAKTPFDQGECPVSGNAGFSTTIFSMTRFPDERLNVRESQPVHILYSTRISYLLPFFVSNCVTRFSFMFGLSLMMEWEMGLIYILCMFCSILSVREIWDSLGFIEHFWFQTCYSIYWTFSILQINETPALCEYWSLNVSNRIRWIIIEYYSIDQLTYFQSDAYIFRRM